MAAVQQQNEGGARAAFNRAATRFGDWMSEKKYGRNEDRLAEITARIAALPGGAEMLQAAKDLKASIAVRPKRDLHGALGHVRPEGDGIAVEIANNGNPAAMALTLWHELRHVLQQAVGGGKFMSGGNLKDPRTSHMLSLMHEADAFTSETLMAAQEKRKGNPEYHDILAAGGGEGPYRTIGRFLNQRPLECFKDDAAFSRALFTEMMLDGLNSYRAQYFGRHMAQFAQIQDAQSFRNTLANAAVPGTALGPALTRIYGDGFSATSVQALATAFLQAQPEDEQAAINLVDKTAAKSGTLTEQEFKAARDDILKRTREIYSKDPDEGNYRGPASDKAAQYLRTSAASDAPADLKALRKAAQQKSPPPDWLPKPRG